MPGKTIVFDAGDTLISVNPAFSGPMAHWSKLEVVPGVPEMLTNMDRGCRLVVASNAADSDAPLVQAALARLGLEQYFSACYTPAELDGARKPDKSFFLALEQHLGVPQSDLVMVGDAYDNDVVGAVRAGWISIWYNAAGKAAPALNPLHTAEITRMIDLPQAFKNLALPTVTDAKAWLVEQGANTSLLLHVEMVAALAYQMAVWLRQAGELVNPVLAHRGGLLHDLAKVPAKRQKTDHGLLAAKMLEERNQAEIAQIAARHVIFDLLSADRQPRTWEEKLVYFADKLVESGEIVNYHQRLAAMQARHKHPLPESQLNALFSALSTLEGEICRVLNWTPDHLLEQLRLAYSGK